MAANDIAITWLGHAAFSIMTPEGKVILIDPFLSGNPVCPANLKEPQTVDVILITHGHGDHLGDAVPLAARTQPEAVVTTADISYWLGKQGVGNVIGMNKGGTIRVADLAVMMVHAEHTSTIMDGDMLIPAGESVGYVVTFSNGSEALRRRRYGALWRHGLNRPPLSARRGNPAHRRPFHDGAGRRGGSLPLAGCKAGHSMPLRHIPPPNGHARFLPRGGAGH